MNWELGGLSGHCAQCGNAFGEQESICSEVIESGDSFERRDFCVVCGANARQEQVFARWRTVTPSKEAPPLRKAVNQVAVWEFFENLAGAEDRMKRSFRYVLALMLMRRKTLRFLGVRRSESGEELLLRDPRNSVEHAVYNPQLGEEEILALTAEVGKVLNLHVEAPEQAAQGSEE